MYLHNTAVTLFLTPRVDKVNLIDKIQRASNVHYQGNMCMKTSKNKASCHGFLNQIDHSGSIVKLQMRSPNMLKTWAIHNQTNIHMDLIAPPRAYTSRAGIL